MAKYRQVQISFWQDPFVLDLPPEEKFFYLYLMTNSKTTQCGIYELPLKVLEMETGLSSDRIFELLYKFVSYKKIRYNEETREIFLLNWLKHNSMKSPKVRACAVKELEEVKHIPYVHEFAKLSKQYGYPIDSLSIDSGEEQEQEYEQEEEQEEEQGNVNPTNLHSKKIALWITEFKIKGAGTEGLQELCSYVGQLDLELIRKALAKSERKHVNYAIEIINGYLEEGITTSDQLAPKKGDPKPPQRDKELMARDYEIALNKHIANGGNPDEFRYPDASNH